MSEKTLKTTIFKSFFPLFFSCVLVLISALLALTYLQSYTNNIVYKRIPVTEAASEFVISIDNCIAELKQKVLTGKNKKNREMLGCNSKLDRSLLTLERIIESKAQTDKIRKLLAMMKSSIWYVLDISETPANNPAQLIYERELLPIYSNIQSALGGLPHREASDDRTNNIETTVATTHQILTEAIRRLSDVRNHGEVYEIMQFRMSASSVEKEIEQLKRKSAFGSHEEKLLLWLAREYHTYKTFAERSLDSRQPADWNQAIHTIRIESEPLAAEIRSNLEKLKIQNSKELQISTNNSVKLTWVIITFLLTAITLMGFLTVRSVRVIANNFHERIDALSQAANLIGKESFKSLYLPDDSPIELKSLANDINQSAEKIENQTKGLHQVINALKTYSQIISHDLKTPIINVIGYITVLNEIVSTIDKERSRSLTDPEVDDLVNAIDYIERSFTKIQLFISSIIDNSRIFSHDTKKQKVLIKTLVNDALSFFSFDSHHLKLNISDLLEIDTDAFLLEHILINLIDNSIKYAREDVQLKLTISGSVNRNELILSVRDNGIGVSPAINIAEPFLQGTNKSEGFGLGLALSVSMAEQLEGRIIWGNNVDDFGTEFKVYLPIH